MKRTILLLALLLAVLLPAPLSLIADEAGVRAEAQAEEAESRSEEKKIDPRRLSSSIWATATAGKCLSATTCAYPCR